LPQAVGALVGKYETSQPELALFDLMHLTPSALSVIHHFDAIEHAGAP
jgi:hypothetical protein